MSENTEGWHDPKNYRAMSEPHATPEAANAALELFLNGVKELRRTCRIQDVHVCCAFTVLYGDGEEGTAMSDAHYGDVTRSEAMLAFAFGKATTARRELVNKFLDGKGTGKRK